MTTELGIGDNSQNKEIIDWAYEYLSSHEYTLKSSLPEVVQNTPWSYVLRFATAEGYIYLKHTPKLLALEANILEILNSQFHISVPDVIAHNPKLNCFLMKDAGISLRVILKQQFDTKLFCMAIAQFTSMQIVVANHVNIFIDIGVPDWRLDKLPNLYMELLSQKAILLEDGLNENEIIQLERLLPKVTNLCEKLSNFSIKQSVVQPDFNDNNTLISKVSREITMIDLGEIVISHPFFSLVNCLDMAKKYYAITDEDSTYHQIMDACLENYLIFEPKSHLLDAFAISRILFFIYAALANYRLMVACNKERFTSSFQRHGRPSIPLREFIKVYKEYK